jgi:hypothetical protein
MSQMRGTENAVEYCDPTNLGFTGEYVRLSGLRRAVFGHARATHLDSPFLLPRLGVVEQNVLGVLAPALSLKCPKRRNLRACGAIDWEPMACCHLHLLIPLLAKMPYIPRFLDHTVAATF